MPVFWYAGLPAADSILNLDDFSIRFDINNKIPDCDECNILCTYNIKIEWNNFGGSCECQNHIQRRFFYNFIAFTGSKHFFQTKTSVVRKIKVF